MRAYIPAVILVPFLDYPLAHLRLADGTSSTATRRASYYRRPREWLRVLDHTPPCFPFFFPSIPSCPRILGRTLFTGLRLSSPGQPRQASVDGLAMCTTLSAPRLSTRSRTRCRCLCRCHPS